MKSNALISQRTLSWIKSFVIEYNLCPFAKRVVDDNSIHLHVVEANAWEDALDAFLSAVHHLDENPTIETSFIIFPTLLPDFFEYLDFSASAEKRLFNEGYEGVYQVATFHPNYCFAGENTTDVSNYTNRSPYPMLHLLRENSLDAAIRYYGNTEHIPENNIARLRGLGLEVVKKIIGAD